MHSTARTPRLRRVQSSAYPSLRARNCFMHWRLCGLHLFPIGSVTCTLHSLIFRSCHPYKLSGLTTSSLQPLLLVRVPVAVHVDLSSSPKNFRLDFILCLLIVVWHRFMCDDVDEHENERASYENRRRLAALARAALSNPPALTCDNGPTGLHPGQTGWFHDGLESPRWSSQHVPGAPQRH